VTDTPDVDQELTAELVDGVLTLTINRADSSNAIPYYVRDRLIRHFQDAHSDLSVRAVILTGAGERHFCTGSDLRIRPPMPEKPEGAPDAVVGTAIQMMRTGFQRLMESIQDCQKPVVVALNGTAAGGGTMLVLAADLVIAADNARFVDVFTSNALIPDGGFAYLLPHIVGMHKAKELVFFGDTLSAAELADLGIVNKVVPAAELEAEARAWATRLAAKPTKVVGWAKKLLHDAVSLPRTAVLEEELFTQTLVTQSDDSKEGMNSFRERRKPVFRGR
jgi:2-(1,2-epoxy-1,2-dihydrophenyl)acetyl-CoA isomerase